MVKSPRKAIVVMIIGKRSCWGTEVPNWTTDISIASMGTAHVKLVLRWGKRNYRDRKAIAIKQRHSCICRVIFGLIKCFLNEELCRYCQFPKNVSLEVF